MLNKSSNAEATSSVFLVAFGLSSSTSKGKSFISLVGVLLSCTLESVSSATEDYPSSFFEVLPGFNHPSNTSFNSS